MLVHDVHTENLISLARCRHFGICGGCKSQNIDYASQLFQKTEFIKSCFGQDIEPIVASPHIWGYRNKMEFTFSQAKSQEQFLGLLKRRSRVENLFECHLTSSWFMETLAKMRSWWKENPLPAYNPPKNTGLLRTLTLREGHFTKEKMVVLTITQEPCDQMLLESLKELFSDADTVVIRRMITEKKCPTRFEERVLKGSGYIHERLCGRLFRIRAASFFQPNSRAAELIYQMAVENARIEPGELVWDLYCGTGALGIFAAPKAARVYGIEIVKEAVEDAHANLVLNDISNMTIELGDVGEKISSLESPDTIFVDPPRAGLLDKTISLLASSQAKKIIYVSCNPQSQAFDCQKLSTDYFIEKIIPVDQFPHTPHVENIVRLRRKT